MTATQDKTPEKSQYAWTSNVVNPQFAWQEQAPNKHTCSLGSLGVVEAYSLEENGVWNVSFGNCIQYNDGKPTPFESLAIAKLAALVFARKIIQEDLFLLEVLIGQRDESLGDE